MSILKHPNRLKQTLQATAIATLGLIGLTGPQKETPPTAHTDAAVLRFENGRTFLDGCFSPDNGLAPDIIGTLAIQSFEYSYSSYSHTFQTNIDPVFTSENEGESKTYNISLQYMHKQAVYHPDNKRGVLVSANNKQAVQCTEELPSDIQPPSAWEGSVVRIGRDSRDKPTVISGPFNETTYHDIDQGFILARTILADGTHTPVVGIHTPFGPNNGTAVLAESK